MSQPGLHTEFHVRLSYLLKFWFQKIKAAEPLRWFTNIKSLPTRPNEQEEAAAAASAA